MNFSRLFISILLFIFSFSYTQYKGPYADSSYSDLESKIKSLEKDPSKQWEYIIDLIKKAKSENNLKQIRRGYVLASFNQRGADQIKYSDSVVIYARKINQTNLLGDSYLLLGMTYVTNENYPRALDSFLKGYDYIQKGKDPYLLHNAEYQIARVKNYLGLYKEADTLFEKSVNFFRDNHKKIGDTDYRYYYIYSLIAYSDNNNQINKQGDFKLIDEGKNFIKNNKDLKEYYPYFISLEGTTHYFHKNYSQAINTLNEALRLYEDNWKHLSDKFYIGMSYWNLNQKEQAIPYFLELDREYEKTGKLDPFFRPAFEILIKYYSQANDVRKQLQYVNKLMALDKIYERDYKYLYGTLKKEYDTKKLSDEKENLENTLKWERTLYITLIFLGLTIMSFLAFHLIKTYKRKKYFKKLYEELFISQKEKDEKEPFLKDQPIESDDEKKIIHNTLNINPLIIENVLNQLNIFETEKHFLKRDITLLSLSKTCGTNTTYMSKILNHYKNENLSGYLNNLRLNHIVSQWKNKPKTRYISLQETAEKAGYNSTQAFAKNFQEKYQIPPSYFLNRLNEEEKHR
ncbi:helix-turn-helix domain-containing protein [Chryseobacterium sp. RG1]|uniref:Helix-turn-helix domain-containing protein n=1 Tax=Chryseobacterium tagetis TaxID=2801334 RepID=A0ABS8A661_9FLAO|nr:helix-turn-helix domain-containing protein [Chryseobacterium tagetis]MCA6068400.1 helix-turn-helix domain-containing protein [Chryseobacterium tagetis]